MSGFVPWPTKAETPGAPDISKVKTPEPPTIAASEEEKPETTAAGDVQDLVPTVKKATHPY